MKINVEGLAPNLRPKAITAIEAIPGLEAHFLPRLSTVPARMVFEVKDGDPDAAAGQMKMVMFRTFGIAIVWRVIPHGKLAD